MGSQSLNLDANESTRLRHESATKDNVWAGRTSLEKALLMVVVLLIAVGICMLIALIDFYRDDQALINSDPSTYSKPCEFNLTECKTKPCIKSAARFVRSMDLSVDPCVDFYNFSCGGFIKSSLGESSLVSQFTEMNTNIKLTIKDILEGPINEKTTEHARKTANFYKACMNLHSREKSGAKNFLDDVREMGGWPLLLTSKDPPWDPNTFQWNKLLLSLFNKGYDKNSLLTIDVEEDPKNTSKTMIVIDQPKFAMKTISSYTEERLLHAYQEFLLKIAKFLNPQLDEAQAKVDISDVLEIEKRLANASLTSSEHLHIAKHYNIMTLKEIQDFAPKIPWRYLLNGMLPKNMTNTDSERLLIVVPSAVQALQRILGDHDNDNDKGRRALANYLFGRAAALSAFYLSHRFEQAYHDFHNMISGNLFSYPEMWKECVDTTLHFFHKSLSATYVHRYVDNATKSSLFSMFEDIQNSLLEEIEHADWLESATRDYAIHKVNSMRTALAYQDEIMNDTILNEYYGRVQVDENFFRDVQAARRWFQLIQMEGLNEEHERFSWELTSNLLTANGFYTPNQNGITITVGILQEGAYEIGRPNYLNYGSLGMIIGHELTHAFDVTGSQYDALGNFKMWWETESWEKFLDKYACYEKQYNQYVEPSIHMTLNGTGTLGENTADNGGLQTAYIAYNKWLQRNGHSEPRLPGIPYTGKQMFWVAFASIWCRKQSKASLMGTVLNDAHSPARFRVNGAVSNLKEFSEDFGCGVDAPMNPKKQCYLWT